ncbi:MAG: ATP-dependent zinc metalloprotease FtsH [Cyclobacteriaceae bacterium]
MSDKKKGNLMPKNPKRPSYPLWGLVILAFLVVGVYMVQGFRNPTDIPYSRFETMARNGEIERVNIITNQKFLEIFLTREARQKYEKEIGVESPLGSGFDDEAQFKTNIASAENTEKAIKTINEELDGEIAYSLSERQNLFSDVFQFGILLLVIFGFWFLMRRMASGGGPGGQIFNISKSKAALFDAENKVKITFDNVAGLDEAKEEIKEIVEFLKNPGKFTKLGGKIPKGALLVGPPGTGKTLLAKAVAGEAGVPFFSLSGSDFVEMFVGVGAARVRDLFKQAKDKAPCIIFIDEIDAIGRSRGRGSMPGSNDERENTLNSLLVEMDGFSTDSGVIILAATNRPDVLDSALLRPGRFDRQISIDKPDIVGREAIFKVHLGPIKISENVDPKKLAAQTPGFAGAEIANVCNEAALIAARRDKEKVDMQDFQDAIDRVIGGLEKKNKIISPEEKKIVAYHEAGHAVAGWFLEHADPLVKVSIVPRGVAALGYAQYLPKEQFLHQTEQLFDEMCMTMGGRAAEDLIFGKISTGALSDLERVTKLAYSIVSVYGMNDKIGNVSFYDSKQEDYKFQKPYSEATAETIDNEVRILVKQAYDASKGLLSKHQDELEIIAKELLEKEIIFQSDLERLIGKRPFDKQTTYQAYTNGEYVKEGAAPDATKIEDQEDTKADKEQEEESPSSAK